MLQEYNTNPDSELARKILQKVRNNRVTNSNFCSDIKDELSTLSDVRNAEEQKKELEDNYITISTLEREIEFKKIHDALMKIREYTEKGD